MKEINIPVKTCKRCGEIFVTGYYASVGIQFWLTALTLVESFIGAVRGRSERCPKCKGREYETTFKTIEV